MTLLTLSLWVVLAAEPSAVVEGTLRFEEKTLFGTSEVKAGKAGEAVVFVESAAAPGNTAATPPPMRAQMRQQNKAFTPKLVTVTVGSEVEFPNDDLVFHNAFSLSTGNQFDLGVYRQGTSKSVRFNRAGVVDVFCNIHPDMVASIVVVPTAHFVKVGEDGRFRLELPPGQYTLVAYWSRGVLERKPVELHARETVSWSPTLVDSGERARHLNKHGQQYGRYK